MSGSNYYFYKLGTVVCYQSLSIVLIPSQVLFNVTKRAPIKEAFFLAASYRLCANLESQIKEQPL